MAYLGEDVQLAHDVLQGAGQRLGHAGGLLGLALPQLLTPASAWRDGERRFWLKRRRGESAQSYTSARGNTEGQASERRARRRRGEGPKCR